MVHLVIDGLGHPEGADVLSRGSVVVGETYTGKRLRYALVLWGDTNPRTARRLAADDTISPFCALP